MNQKEEFRKLKERIEDDPNTPRCGRCGSILLGGSRELLCGVCSGKSSGLPWPLILLLLAILTGVLLLGVKWIVESGGAR